MLLEATAPVALPPARRRAASLILSRARTARGWSQHRAAMAATLRLDPESDGPITRWWVDWIEGAPAIPLANPPRLFALMAALEVNPLAYFEALGLPIEWAVCQCEACRRSGSDTRLLAKRIAGKAADAYRVELAVGETFDEIAFLQAVTSAGGEVLAEAGE